MSRLYKKNKLLKTQDMNSRHRFIICEIRSYRELRTFFQSQLNKMTEEVARDLVGQCDQLLTLTESDTERENLEDLKDDIKELIQGMTKYTKKDCEKIYQSLVLEAKQHIRQIEVYQAKVAKLALKACEIRHGGKSKGIYTITDFARDIGMSRKVLSEWIHVYRDICLVSGIRTPTLKEWKCANQTDKIIQSANVAKNKRDNTVKTKRKETPKEEVKRIFNKVLTGEAADMVSFERILKAQKHNLYVTKSVNLKNVDKVKIEDMLDYARQTVKQLEEFLKESDA